MTLEEYVDIIEHSEFEWDGIGDNKCIGGDAYYTAHGIRKPLIGYREKAWHSSARDCSYPDGVMVFYERDSANTEYWHVKHKWARTREEALVLMKEHLDYFIRYVKERRGAEIRRCADAYEQ